MDPQKIALWGFVAVCATITFTMIVALFWSWITTVFQPAAGAAAVAPGPRRWRVWWIAGGVAVGGLALTALFYPGWFGMRHGPGQNLPPTTASSAASAGDAAVKAIAAAPCNAAGAACITPTIPWMHTLWPMWLCMLAFFLLIAAIGFSLALWLVPAFRTRIHHRVFAAGNWLQNNPWRALALAVALAALLAFLLCWLIGLNWTHLALLLLFAVALPIGLAVFLRSQQNRQWLRQNPRQVVVGLLGITALFSLIMSVDTRSIWWFLAFADTAVIALVLNSAKYGWRFDRWLLEEKIVTTGNPPVASKRRNHLSALMLSHIFMILVYLGLTDLMKIEYNIFWAFMLSIAWLAGYGIGEKFLEPITKALTIGTVSLVAAWLTLQLLGRLAIQYLLPLWLFAFLFGLLLAWAGERRRRSSSQTHARAGEIMADVGKALCLTVLLAIIWCAAKDVGTPTQFLGRTWGYVLGIADDATTWQAKRQRQEAKAATTALTSVSVPGSTTSSSPSVPTSPGSPSVTPGMTPAAFSQSPQRVIVEVVHRDESGGTLRQSVTQPAAESPRKRGEDDELSDEQIQRIERAFDRTADRMQQNTDRFVESLRR